MSRTYSVELFENRRLLSGATATFTGGVLEIRGTGDSDALTVSLDPSGSQVIAAEADGTYGVGDPVLATMSLPGILAIVPLAQVQRIIVFASDGNDDIRIMVDLPAEVHGAAGDDTILTAGGNDQIFGGQGDDNIDAGAGNDTVFGKDGCDQIRGGDGHDLIYGQGKNDTIYGNSGNDTLCGNAGSDELYGGLGNDSISTGTGELMSDGSSTSPWGWWITLPMFHDSVRGGQGDDYILASSSDTVWGGAGHDTFNHLSPEPPTLGDYNSGEDTLLPEDVRDLPVLL